MSICTRMSAIAGCGLMAVGAVAAFAPPALADLTGDTGVTVAITGGDLSISVDTTARTITAQAGAVTTTGSTTLGQTVVTDNRAAGLTVTVKASSAADFAKSGGGTALLRSYGTVAAGTFTKTGGFSSAVVADPGTGILSSAGGTFVTATGVAGTGTLTFSPTLTFTVPAAATVAGTYTGTVTQTAS